MAFMGKHYDGRLEAMQTAHSKEIASLRRQHTREKNEIKKEIYSRLDDLKRQPEGVKCN